MLTTPQSNRQINYSQNQNQNGSEFNRKNTFDVSYNLLTPGQELNSVGKTIRNQNEMQGRQEREARRTIGNQTKLQVRQERQAGKFQQQTRTNKIKQVGQSNIFERSSFKEQKQEDIKQIKQSPIDGQKQTYKRGRNKQLSLKQRISSRADQFPLQIQRGNSQKVQNQLYDKQEQASLHQEDFALGQSGNQGQQYTRQQLEYHIGMIQNMWQYRYTRYLEDGVYNKQWMKLFSFLGEFKEKCIQLVKKLVQTNLTAYKMLQDIDYRSNMKNQGQEGIYLVDGIIIRMAKIKFKQNRDIDESAVKGLHQEYLAYNVLNNLAISMIKDEEFEKVKVPLTTLVKYLGYTALCQADTPCEGLQTLIHGPTATIYQYREQSMPILFRIGEQLNLKHFKMLSKDRKVLTIPFSLTVELHKVTRQIKIDNYLTWLNKDSVLYPKNGTLFYQKPEYYLLNVRKLWPLFIDSDIMKSSGHLRPQVVLGWKNKLSNTVFSKIAYRQDPNSQLQLADACKTLKQQNVKVLAKMLDNTTIFLIDSEGIEQIMHEYGVNMRFMGQLANKVTLEFSKKVLQVQMIARTCKKYFYPTFNELSSNGSVKDVLTFLKQVFVDFLNLIFIRNEEGEKFYRKYIYDKIRTYYEYEIKDYPPNIPGGGLLHALAYHFGIKVKVIDYPFFQLGVDSIFNISHITEVVGFAKTFDMDTSEIKLVCRKFKQKRKKNKLQQCISQLKILAIINKCLNHQNTHNIGPHRQSYYYAELAQIYFSLKQYETSKNYAQLSIRGIPQKHADAIKPFGVLIKYYSVKKQINRCIEYYEKSLGYLGYHLSSDHPLTISVYNTLGYEFVSSMDPSKCEKIFMKSFQICEQALGYMHHTSSQILMQLAGLPLPPQKTINFLLQALTILQNLGQHEQLIKQVCMRISQQYDKLGNVQKMIYFARKSQHWMMQIRGQDKLNHDKNLFQLTNRVPKNTDEVLFLTYYAVKSYLRTLERIPKDTLYKVFVTYKDNLISKQVAAASLMKRMTSDRSSVNNAAEFIKTNFVLIFRQISKKLSKHHFYITKIQDWDKYLKGLLQVFVQIMSAIGLDDAENMFSAYIKTL